MRTKKGEKRGNTRIETREKKGIQEEEEEKAGERKKRKEMEEETKKTERGRKGSRVKGEER